MKRVTAFIIAFLIHGAIMAQFEMGVKMGLSSMDLTDASVIIPSSDETIKLEVANANYGYHFGIYSRIKLFNLFIEPAVLFNSNTIDYNLESQIFDEGIFSTIRSETYNHVDIPLLVGTKIGFLRLQAGPVAHLFLNSTSELVDIEGYEQRFSDATYGFQAGIGLDILKIRLDLNYESNLSRFGEHMTIGGTTFSFDENPSRLIASLGIRF